MRVTRRSWGTAGLVLLSIVGGLAGSFGVLAVGYIVADLAGVTISPLVENLLGASWLPLAGLLCWLLLRTRPAPPYKTKTGRTLTEAELDRLAAEAERGYDVERRREAWDRREEGRQGP